MFLSIVVPCFNEKDSILRFEAELLPELDSLGSSYEIVAVDDGSTDGSLAALKALAARFTELIVISHSQNRGLGAALRTGFGAAQGEWIVALDADLTFHPSQIKTLLAHQQMTGADLVAGSPFLEESGRADVSWTRLLPSLLLNAFYRGLFGRALTAYTPIFRLYRAGVLKTLPLSSRGFEINAEIAARFILKKKKCAEVPATLTSRKEGVSKLNRARELSRHLALIAKLLARREVFNV